MSSQRASLVVLAPIAPAFTGNGLAMRIWAFVAAAAVDHDVHLIVIPIAGSLDKSSVPAGVVAHHRLSPQAVGRPGEAMEWFRDPIWRERVPQLDPVYPGVRSASPSMTPEVLGRLKDLAPLGVLACRLSLAPLGLSVAETLDVPLLVDADDDDVEFHLSRGEPDLAAAAERVGRLCLPRARLVTAASPADARRLADRYGLGEAVEVVPNSVDLPSSESLTAPTGNGRVLFLGNLTYGPNIEGAHWLAREVLPQLPTRYCIDLVGAPGPAVTELADDRIRVHGAVADVAGAYREADVAVVPLWSGSGTRTKMLEAFAYGRPVVSTTVGAEGIAAVDGEHLAIADTAEAFAAAIVRLSQPKQAAPVIRAARELVENSYAAAHVQGRIAALLARAMR